METLSTGIEYFSKGGFVMYILLICSIFVVAIAIERWLFFSQADAGRGFAQQFFEIFSKRDFDGAERLSNNTKGLLPDLLSRAIMRARGADAGSLLSTFLEVQTDIILSQFRKRLYYLSVIVTMAPLLGLLGTISGMISAFSVFNLESGQATAITGGVGEALIATAFGLCVAIISLVVHSYFTQRIDSIISDMEQCLSLVEGEVDSMKDAKAGAAV